MGTPQKPTAQPTELSDANFVKLAKQLNRLLDHTWREYFMRCGKYDSVSEVYVTHPGKQIKELLRLLREEGSLSTFRELLEEKGEAVSLATINASEVKHLFYNHS